MRRIPANADPRFRRGLAFACFRLVLIELQAILQLAERFVRCFDGFHAVPAKIVRGMFQVILGPAQRGNRFPDFGVRLRQSRWRSRG